MKDVVVDASVMRLYDQPKDGRSGREPIWVLLNELSRSGRYTVVPNAKLNAFKRDTHFRYTCNRSDIPHARLAFLSSRKHLVALDRKLVSDVRRFPRVDGSKPCACRRPPPGCCE